MDHIFKSIKNECCNLRMTDPIALHETGPLSDNEFYKDNLKQVVTFCEE